ncbi:hypothetical protein [Indiicoccus explosivorum]|uniref:hypothetical protein n=1 Tax=Indiicoccus explosivorum TaxID=1917864 RepID=UPI000B440856|nr:hypothetical protein [Indiicoccus explosivorum]
MAAYELRKLQMTKSGENIDFASGSFLEKELDGNQQYELVMKNVQRYELFLDNLESEEPVHVTFETFDGKKGRADMTVRTVNREDPKDNIVELETTHPIEFG